MRFTVIIASICVALCAFAQPDPNYHIYICFGQSNMEGNADIEDIDRNDVPEVFKMMATDKFTSPKREIGNWYHATPPLVRQYTGLTPVDWFGRTMLDNQTDITLGVVVLAIGGCKIEHLDKDFDESTLAGEADWFKNYMAIYDNYPYGRLVECAKKAQEVGVIKGMLLHQGESNNGQEDWPDKVNKVYTDLLTDLGLEAEDVPLLVGETVRTEMGGICGWHNTIIAKIGETIPTAHVISSEGLDHKGDGLHFTAESYRILGARYAEKMLSLLASDSQISVNADQPASTDVYNTQGIMVLRNATREQIDRLPTGIYIYGGKRIAIVK